MRDASQALWFAEHATQTGLVREDACMALMRAQMFAGRRSQAINTYLRCADYLREELGLDPSSELERLYATLLDAPASLPRGDSPRREHAAALALC